MLFAVRVNTYGAQEWKEEIPGALKCKANVGVDWSDEIMYIYMTAICVALE